MVPLISILGYSNEPPLAINLGSNQKIRLPMPKELGFDSSQVLNGSTVSTKSSYSLSFRVDEVQPLTQPSRVMALTAINSFLSQGSLSRRRASFWSAVGHKGSQLFGELLIQEGTTVLDI